MRPAPIGCPEETLGCPRVDDPRLVAGAVEALDSFAIEPSAGRNPDAFDLDHDDQPWHIVREKEHPGEPMTVDDALFHMELLGHDFYLFMDKDSGRPSVVYRRRAYDYGVISLGM